MSTSFNKYEGTCFDELGGGGEKILLKFFF